MKCREEGQGKERCKEWQERRGVRMRDRQGTERMAHPRRRYGKLGTVSEQDKMSQPNSWLKVMNELHLFWIILGYIQTVKTLQRMLS